MANKRFSKPIRPDVTIPAIRDQQTIDANRDTLWRDEYRYALRQARETGFNLCDAKTIARNSANALFE